jgi:hypothetical protein
VVGLCCEDAALGKKMVLNPSTLEYMDFAVKNSINTGPGVNVAVANNIESALGMNRWQFFEKYNTAVVLCESAVIAGLIEAILGHPAGIDSILQAVVEGEII